ncbi:unnamed protein product [Brachionus calyciflorus]|uniref:Uncharacterized protein n=1 Tax=Brachionus calyciflorus TaxID=104777 RepID=A0A813MAB3_9BILA|nr:unnamed protein product [Brachionus calyciflorus]
MGTNESKFTGYSDEGENSKNQQAVIVQSNYDESETETNDYENLSDQNSNNHYIQSNSLRFHDVCGKNIIISNNKQNAKRVERSFCDAIVFSNRPIEVYERIYVKITGLSSMWNGMLRFGLTSVNPDIHRKSLYQKEDLNKEKNNLDDDESSDDDYLFDLPKYVYPNLTNRKGYWAGAIPQNLVKENDILYFYVNSNGEIHYGINNCYKGQFLDGVEVYKKPQNPRSLWAVFDIYGNTLSIELINRVNDTNNNVRSLDSDYESSTTISSFTNNFRTLSTNNSSETNLNSIGSSINSSDTLITIIPNQNTNVTVRQNRQNRRSVEDNFDRLLISHRQLCVDNHLNKTLSDSIVHDSDTVAQKELNEKIKNFYESIPVLIHEKSESFLRNSYKFNSKIHGKNVNICEPDCSIAYRESSIRQMKNSKMTDLNTKEPTRNAYVFLDKPIEIGTAFCLQIVGIDQSLNESKMSLGIGCTTCNPNQLNPQKDLPNDADSLLDRREYWVVFQNLFNSDIVTKKHNVSLADELCFIIEENTGNLKFYINGCLITDCLFNVDTTQKLWFFFDLCGRTNVIRLIKPCQKWNRVNGRVNRTRPNSALIDYYKSHIIPEEEERENVDNSQNRIAKSEKHKRNSGLEECCICLDAPIQCVFYSCGHMCVCWNCAVGLKKSNAQDSISQRGTQNNTQAKNPSKPICPICRNEIIDIIRVFKS